MVYRDIRNQCVNLRTKLLVKESNKASANNITTGFWNLTEKARFDIVTEDFERISWHIDFSIENINKIFPSVSKIENEQQYFQSNSDDIFWYYMDNVIRSISSGWDRLGILLDIAFEINLCTNVNLHKVLLEMAKTYPHLSGNVEFVRLQNIQKYELQVLESSKGKGIRHESTHSMTLGTKFWFEFLEKSSLKQKNIMKMQKEWFDEIIKLKETLREGKEKTIDLIEFHTGTI